MRYLKRIGTCIYARIGLINQNSLCINCKWLGRYCSLAATASISGTFARPFLAVGHWFWIFNLERFVVLLASHCQCCSQFVTWQSWRVRSLKHRSVTRVTLKLFIDMIWCTWFILCYRHCVLRWTRSGTKGAKCCPHGPACLAAGTATSNLACAPGGRDATHLKVFGNRLRIRLEIEIFGILAIQNSFYLWQHVPRASVARVIFRCIELVIEPRKTQQSSTSLTGQLAVTIRQSLGRNSCHKVDRPVVTSDDLRGLIAWSCSWLIGMKWRSWTPCALVTGAAFMTTWWKGDRVAKIQVIV